MAIEEKTETHYVVMIKVKKIIKSYSRSTTFGNPQGTVEKTTSDDEVVSVVFKKADLIDALKMATKYFSVIEDPDIEL